MHFTSLRLGRFEFFAQRETLPARFAVDRSDKGEVIIYLPLRGIALVNQSTFGKQHRQA
ncbi:hypothetical protein [Sulfitobacter sp. TBRI5]|uniref:hypothetical protein n=1 Tax=Sulfitobacter sp. TBRI5 TaxID=2989732 RepID=UPI003D9BD163